jgi:RNA polymerase sigma-70 factor (sigma-E family)
MSVGNEVLRGGPVTGGDVEMAYRALGPSLMRLAWLLTSCRADAEDVLQNVFARYGRLECRPARPDAYLRTMVVNSARDVYRSRARADRLVESVEDDPVEADPEVIEVWDAVQRLPRDQREVLVLRYHDDLSTEEVAEVLGCPVGTVRSRLSRGLARLRKEYR